MRKNSMADLTQTEITISGPGVSLSFAYRHDRLALTQIQRDGDAPMLFVDRDGAQAGAGPIGNPLSVIILSGEFAGTYGIEAFSVTALTHTDRHILAYLRHATMPMRIAIEVEVEGHVITWRGQVAWNGADPVEAEVYFPLLSRVRFAGLQGDRAIMAQVSGAVHQGIGSLNFRQSYLGNFSAPMFMVEGGGRGMAVLDDNRADYAADPGACVQRLYQVGNEFPLLENTPKHYMMNQANHGGDAGPFVGVCHKRRFNVAAQPTQPVTEIPEDRREPPPMVCAGDAIDLGPVRTYLYAGGWKVGAHWLREQRQHVPFRKSPAEWYQQTTFIAEDMGDHMEARTNVL
jgi:hypothetical protein